ncbi:MAG: hypothetical protein ACUVRK_10295 [Spirochaetota bacterium]
MVIINDIPYFIYNNMLYKADKKIVSDVYVNDVVSVDGTIVYLFDNKYIKKLDDDDYIEIEWATNLTTNNEWIGAYGSRKIYIINKHIELVFTIDIGETIIGLSFDEKAKKRFDFIATTGSSIYRYYKNIIEEYILSEVLLDISDPEYFGYTQGVLAPFSDIKKFDIGIPVKKVKGFFLPSFPGKPFASMIFLAHYTLYLLIWYANAIAFGGIVHENVDEFCVYGSKVYIRKDANIYFTDFSHSEFIGEAVPSLTSQNVTSNM